MLSLNHCFDKILHLENGDLQEFDRYLQRIPLQASAEKIELKFQHIEEQEEIARTEEMVEILRKRATLMVNPTIGQAVNAKQSQLDRLLARQIKAPFIEVREPHIAFPQVETGGEPEDGENGKQSGAHEANARNPHGTCAYELRIESREVLAARVKF